VQVIDKNLSQLLHIASEIRRKNFGSTIKFYAPSFLHYKNAAFNNPKNYFPSISITGTSCTLLCKHCNAQILKTMISATTPQRLIDVCRRLSEQGSKGCLISGGCLPDGSLPLEKFLDSIAQIKKEYDLTIAIHTGIITQKVANGLKEAGVDSVLIDIIGSDDTIKEIYKLNITVKNYEASLKALHDSEINFVPHVIVGLHYGKLKGELTALDMISQYNPRALVIIALTPLRNTLLRGINPPPPKDIAKILSTARIMFPDIPLALGCMRPTGKHRTETDKLALAAGVNAIAFPDEIIIEYAKVSGLKIEFLPVCCSQIYEL
jgi:uncharacterized radical SAM superfamily protein